ncbi:hypothetical protein vseg_015180 [Gypsophila vaccaria]
MLECFLSMCRHIQSCASSIRSSHGVLMVPMLAPRSYTCEDVIKLQCHGSEVCLRHVLRACLDAAARLAEPVGEEV